MKQKSRISPIVNIAILMLIIICAFNCNKKNNPVPNAASSDSKPLNFTFGIPDGTNVQFLPGIEKQSSPSKDVRKSPSVTEALKVSSCNYGFGRSFAGNGYYAYPNDTLELSYTTPGTTVSLYVQAYDVPNRFTIYDPLGYVMASSPWMGYASYSGPWGMSLNTSSTGTLTFTKGNYNNYYLKVETSTYNNTDSYSASIGCPSPAPQVSITSIQDANISNIMINSFNSLQVNLPELSSELGLTLTADSIDFTNLSKNYVSNSYDTGYAICAPIKNNNNCGFILYTDGANYGRPTIVKVTSTQLIYFDLSNDLITTVTNFKSSNFTFSQIYGSYMSRATDCGQATINCFIDAYSNHGFASIWATIQTLAWWPTGAAIMGSCAIKNCIPKEI
jgi:hypothetical protein